MRERTLPRRETVRLPVDGLAYALREAGLLVAEVLAGHNLTEAFEQRRREARPSWPDGTRGAIRDLAWGTLRDYGRGQCMLAGFVHKPLPDEVTGLLLVAIHRLGVRPELAHTVVNQAVEACAAQAPGLKGVVNGVLRNCLREWQRLQAVIDDDPAARHAHPDWWVEALRHDHPTHWERILAAGNTRPPMALRVNRLQLAPETFAEQLRAAGMDCRRLDNDAILLEQAVAVERLPGFTEGRVSVQDAGAQYAARLLDLADGQRVLDACAAPGGKTAHILETARVHLTALELDPLRVRRVTDNLNRLGLTAAVHTADAAAVADWWDGKPYDRILADVPCSASGVVRRHPDIKWLRRRDDLARFAAQQRKILDALWQTLAPGGKLLYVTCSLFDVENRQQIDAFCARHADARKVPLDAAECDRQLLPCNEHDGFYYALLQKCA